MASGFYRGLKLDDLTSAIFAGHVGDLALLNEVILELRLLRPKLIPEFGSSKSSLSKSVSLTPVSSEKPYLFYW